MSKVVLKSQLELIRYVIDGSAEGMGDDEALAAPPTGGNSFNWILGHILVSRGKTLSLLGDETGVVSAAKAGPYVRGSDGGLEPSSAMSLAAMLRALDASQMRIVDALERLDDEALSRVVTESPFGREEETLGTMLAGFFFHEAYHAGQLGLLRRLAGREGVIK